MSSPYEHYIVEEWVERERNKKYTQINKRLSISDADTGYLKNRTGEIFQGTMSRWKGQSRMKLAIVNRVVRKVLPCRGHLK